MATDSTHLPQGETNVDVGTDMSGSELDLTAVQLAQVEGAQSVELPKGNQVILIPVKPGQVIELPTDSTDGLLAKIGPAPEGNLAIVVDGRTIILQGYVHANEQSPVKVVTNDGDTVDVADVVAATDPSLDIQTAAGPATNPGDTAPDSSGIFIPFGPGADLGGLHAAGILDPTALAYKLIDDERRDFNLEEEEEAGGSTNIDITFDILGGIINEDDLQGAQIIDQPDQFLAKLIVQSGGNDGVGNDPFDDDGDVNDNKDNAPGSHDGVPDSDLEPLVTVATVTVNFNGDVPGKLVVDSSTLPTGLTSDGEEINYAIDPAVAGVHGNGIFAFVESGGGAGYQPGSDRLVFEVHVDKDESDGEFKVTFTLHDNIDNAAPDKNGDGAPDLLGADEQTLGLPVTITAIDSNGTPLSTVLPLGIVDDIPFFGQATEVGEGFIAITPGDSTITHDETSGVNNPPDDQSESDAGSYADDAENKVSAAGFTLPTDAGALDERGIAQKQVLASFGADQASTEFDTFKADNPVARNSIFGELEDRTNADGDGINDGENEHPFELFMIASGSGKNAKPSEDNLNTVVKEGNLTIEDQPTNATVTMNGEILQVFLHQIDAHTIVGYVNAENTEQPEALLAQLDSGQQAVFVLTIDDDGVMTFVQYHQINHNIDGAGGESPVDSHDDPFQILSEDNTPIINVRISDNDGDHATQPVNLVIKDDGPTFEGVKFGETGGQIDEDALPNGINGGPGDNGGGTHVEGVVDFNFGVDQPGHLEVGGLTITDSVDNVIATINADGSFAAGDLRTADGNPISIVASFNTITGILTWVGKDATDNSDVFTLTLHTTGASIGQFDFDLQQALQHPFHDADFKNDNPDSYEDNLNFDFTVRGVDVDGDFADGHIHINIDDDSPDASKVKISIDDGEGGDGFLVQDETAGVQNGGNNSGASDPGASGQDEDDVSPKPADFGAFEAAKSLVSNLGYAATHITVDLSGGTADADAAIGADVPGSVSSISLVGAGGAPLNGAATNLFDTQTGQRIYLFTETAGSETFVVGHVGNNALGPISFALHTTESGGLELGQYRAIEHPNTSQLDESVSLLGENNQQAVVYLQVTVTDADGDSVVVTKPLGGGGEGGSGIVFQDDGPSIHQTENSISLAVDESVGGNGTDLDQPGFVGDLDGPAIENDEALIPLPLPLPLQGYGDVLGAAHADGASLFTFSPGADGLFGANYGLTITNPATGLFDTASGQPIVLGNGSGTIYGVTSPGGDVVFAININGTTGEIVIAQYRAIDHGDEEGTPGAHDELARLAQNTLSVTLTVTDGDLDTVTEHRDISGAVTFDDDGPKADLVKIEVEDPDGEQGDGNLILDETNGNDAGSDDVSGPRAEFTALEIANSLSAIQYAATVVHVDLSGGTGNPNAAYGSDGPGTTHLSLTGTGGANFTGGQTNLHDTATGHTIFLYTEGGLVVGRVGDAGDVANPSGPIAFALSIDDTGNLSMAEYRAIQHPDAPNNYDEAVKLLAADGVTGLVNVTAVVTDKDGDSVSVSLPLDGKDGHGAIVIEDDGPSANPDADSVTEDAAQNYASGNVVAGVDGGLATDANLTDGAADKGGTDGIKAHSVQWADAADAGGIDANNSIAGQYGELQVDDNGNYKYVLNDANPLVNGLEDGQHLQETFTYYVKDGDGDQTTSTLTITIDGHTDARPPTATDTTARVDEDGIPVIGNHDSAPGDDNADLPPDTATPDEHVFHANLPINWNGQEGSASITLTAGDLSALRTIDDHAINVTGNGTGLLQGIDAVTSEVVFTVQIINSTTGEYQVTLSKPLLHPDSDNNHANDATDFGTGGYEDNLTIPVSVTYTSVGGTLVKTLSIDVDDDMPSVAATSGTISLAVDETLGGGTDVAPNPGFAAENDEVAGAPAVTTAGLSTVGLIGAATANAATLFTSAAGADGQASKVYALTITNPGSGLIDTATNSAITLVNNAGVIEGRSAVGNNLVFAIAINATTGQVTIADYRAINHGNEEAAPGNHDELKALAANTLAVTLTVTDRDGDAASASHDISGAVTIDDDGPHSAVISFVAGNDTLDDEGSPLVITSPGIDGASNPADDVAGTSNTVSFDVSVDAGSDGLGSIAYNLAQIQSQNSSLRAVDGTADGASISFSFDGADIVGKINDVTSPLNGTEVLRVHATDTDSFTVTESSPLFHTGQGEINDLSFKVVLDATDKDGDSIQTTAVVKIDDDMPDATPNSGTAEAAPRMNTNLLLILDDSGSMSQDTTLTNTNKLQALQASVNELFEQYGNLGDVRICFVRFDSSSSTLHGPASEVWLTIEQAKTLLATLTASGNTNYDAALLQAMASYQTDTLTDHQLTSADVTGPIQNVGYFISDGIPNDNNSWSSDPYHVPGWVAPATGPGVGASDGVAGINTEEEYLQNFLNQEDIKMYAVGIGDGIDAAAATELKKVSYDGTGSGSNDDANLYIELQDLSQLTQTLVGTVTVPVGGSIGGFGADGGFVSQITLAGGFTVTYNAFTNTFIPTLGGLVTGIQVNPANSPIPGGTNVIRIDLTSGSSLYLNAITGAWQYIPAAGDSGTYNFGFTLTDYDGDTDSDVLTVSTNVGGFKPIVRDDAIITNIAGAFSISDKALLWNDQEKDAGQTISISTNQADLTNILAAGSATRDAINSEIDLTAAAVSFTYKGSSSDGSDTGNVSITHVVGSTLEGNGLDNIIVGGNGDDTLNGYQGNDVLLGGDGNDTLKPGTGNDYVDGGAGTNDILDYSDIGGNWNLTLGSGGHGTANVAGTDTYLGIEGVSGGSGDNVITGNTASNTLNGNDGNDTLDGGNDAVADILNGGAGDDTLIYRGATDTYIGGSNTSNTLTGTNAGDILDISNVSSVDLTSIANSQITGVETIRMTGGGNQTLTLNSQDVVDLGTGTFNPQGSLGFADTIRVDGDIGDVLNLSKGSGEWVEITNSINNEPAGYRVFAFDSSPNAGIQEQSYVIVHQDVTVNNVA